jgi:hypothetical protein
LSRERRRLLASLFFNFVAKVPGIAAVFVVLPLISRGLGTSDYGELLSALALGASFGLPFGGINAVCRRLLGTAVGAGDKREQANVFATNSMFVLVVAVVGSIIMIAATGRSWSRPIFIAVTLLPVIASFFNVYDNIRASYNEHYVTALFQLVFQILVYTGIYLVGVSPGAVLLSGMVIQSPYFLASMATLILLLAQRPYLLRGRVSNVVGVAVPAVGVTLADGSLTLILNLSVYYLSVAGSTGYAAWEGTMVRLFFTFMSPAVLILFPVTTYVSMRWQQLTVERQIGLHKLFLVLGCGYGLLVGAILGVGGPFYIDRMFKLSVNGDTTDVIAISLFMAAVLAQKSYAMLLYAVTEARFVSYGTAVVAIVAIAAAGVATLWLSPIRALDVLFILMGTILPMLLVFSSARYVRRLSRPSTSPVIGG